MLDVRADKNLDVMLLKSEHRSLSQVFQFLGWIMAVCTSAPKRLVISWEVQNLYS